MEQYLADYLDTLGMGGLLGGLFIEAMGLPFPGGVMIMFSGFLILQDRLNFYTVFFLALLGFNLGAAVAFFIGRRAGNPFFDHYGKYLRVKNYDLAQARRCLERSAPVFIIAGRFVPMLSNLTPYLAGASGLKWTHFLFYNFIFTIIWVSFNISVGMLFGHNWPFIAGYLSNRLPVAALGLLAVYLAVKFLIRHIYGLRSERL